MNNRQFFNNVRIAERLGFMPGVKFELSSSAEEAMSQIGIALSTEREAKENMQALNRVRYLIGDEGGRIQAELKLQTEELRKLRDFLREEVV